MRMRRGAAEQEEESVAALRRQPETLEPARSIVADAGLAADLRASVESELAGVAKEATKEKPIAPLILGKLKTIADIAKAAGDVGTKLVPAVTWLVGVAAKVF